VRLRSLLRGSLLYTIGNFLPRVGAFLLLPIYTAAMGPEQFGTFSLMLSISGVLGVLYRLGLDGALMRLHFDVAERDRPGLYLTLTVATAVAGALISAAMAALAMPFFESLFAGAPFWPFAPLTLLLTFLLAFQYVPSSYFRAREMPGRFVLLTGSSFVAGVLATILFVLVLDFGAAGALLGQVAGAMTIVVVGTIVLVSLRPTGLRMDLLSRSFSFGLPLLPHALSAWVLNLSDRWLIGLLAVGGAAAAQAAIGVYSLGYLLGQVVAMVAFSFNAAWVPFFYQRGEAENGRRLLREMTTLSVAGLAVLAAGIGLLAPELTRLIAADRWGEATVEAARVTPVVALASVAYGLYYMVVSPVFLVRRTRVLPLLTIFAGTVNVVLNVILIPRIGIMGAAWATLAGYTTLACLTTWYARRVYRLELDVARLGLVVGGLAALLAVVAVGSSGDGGLLAGWVAHVVLALAFAIVTAFAIREPLARLRLEVAHDRSAATGRMSAPKEIA